MRRLNCLAKPSRRSSEQPKDAANRRADTDRQTDEKGQDYSIVADACQVAFDEPTQTMNRKTKHFEISSSLLASQRKQRAQITQRDEQVEIKQSSQLPVIRLAQLTAPVIGLLVCQFACLSVCLFGKPIHWCPKCCSVVSAATSLLVLCIYAAAAAAANHIARLVRRLQTLQWDCSSSAEANLIDCQAY